MNATHRQREDAQRQRQARLPFAAAEQLVADGDGPIHERCFFKVADAIDVESDPIVIEQHFAGGFGVDRIGVVQQAWPRESRNINQKPCGENGAENCCFR